MADDLRSLLFFFSCFSCPDRHTRRSRVQGARGFWGILRPTVAQCFDCGRPRSGSGILSNLRCVVFPGATSHRAIGSAYGCRRFTGCLAHFVSAADPLALLGVVGGPVRDGRDFVQGSCALAAVTNSSNRPNQVTEPCRSLNRFRHRPVAQTDITAFALDLALIVTSDSRPPQTCHLRAAHIAAKFHEMFARHVARVDRAGAATILGGADDRSLCSDNANHCSRSEIIAPPLRRHARK